MASPPFRTIPDPRSFSLSNNGSFYRFPLTDYIIEFGAGLYFVNAGARRKTKKHQIDPVSSKTIRLFCSKALAHQQIDPIVLKHLIRNAQKNFRTNYTLTQGDKENFTYEAFRITKELSSYNHGHHKNKRQIAGGISVKERIAIMMQSPVWYLRYSNKDRETIASAYLQPSEYLKKETANYTKKHALEARYDRASLILDELPEPAELLNKHFPPQTKAKFDRNTLKTELNAGDFSSIPKNYKDNAEIVTLIAKAIDNLVKKIPKEQLSHKDLGLIFVGPTESLLVRIAKKRNKATLNLNQIPEIEEALNNGKLTLLASYLPEQLAEIAKTQDINKIKSCLRKNNIFSSKLKERLQEVNFMQEDS